MIKEALRYVVLGGIFIVPFIVLLVAEPLFFPYITGKNFAFRIVVEITFAAWMVLALYEPRYRPRFSWILVAVLVLLGVMFVADLLGEFPLKSFWSNYERMAGYVTLAHLGMYFMVVGSVITTREWWNRLLNTALGVAVLLSIYAFAQLLGIASVSQGSAWRVDGTLGNSTYMAIYMLFHIFIAALMFVRTKRGGLHYVYAALIPVFTFLLIQTGTRGATLGLIGGALLTTGYIALFGTDTPRVRKVAAGVLCALVLLGALFVAFRNSSFVQSDERLARIANISLHAGSTRFTIWSMALEGVKERPLLGWGQDNFNYVFNKYYKPSLLGQEPWFDRVHDIVLDWLIAGGILGTLSFFSILAAALYCAIAAPFRKRSRSSFSVYEQGLLLGLLAAYVFHNLFVFDNIISYIFLFLILAYIHSRISQPIARLEVLQVKEQTITRYVLPVVAVGLVAVVYVVNIPSILAARDIIRAFSSPTAEQRLVDFQHALARGSFADQEIREQLVLQTMRDLQSPDVKPETKQLAYNTTEAEIKKEIAEKPGDARVYSFAAMLYRTVGNSDQELAALNEARKYSPDKQLIIFEQAFAYVQKKQYDTALSYLKKAYDLDRTKKDARMLYAIGAVYAGDESLLNQLIDTDTWWREFVLNDLSAQAAHTVGNQALLEKILQARIAYDPSNPQYRVSLSVAYYEKGDAAAAIRELQGASKDFPQYEAQFQAFIKKMQSGEKL